VSKAHFGGKSLHGTQHSEADVAKSSKAIQPGNVAWPMDFQPPTPHPLPAITIIAITAAPFPHHHGHCRRPTSGTNPLSLIAHFW
jgi:hypothetical protein